MLEFRWEIFSSRFQGFRDKEVRDIKVVYCTRKDKVQN